MRLHLCIAILVAPLLFLACDSGTDTAEVWAADYDQSCSVATDCAVVTEGDYCGCVACPNTAIARSDREQFIADANAAEASCIDEQVACGDLDEERARQEASCGEMLPVCESGTCSARMPEDIQQPVVQVVDRSCTNDSDCTTVPASFDNPCGCKVAVRRSGAETAGRIADVQGASGSCTCDADTLGSECVEGTCPLTADECEVTAWSEDQCET